MLTFGGGNGGNFLTCGSLFIIDRSSSKEVIPEILQDCSSASEAKSAAFGMRGAFVLFISKLGVSDSSDGGAFSYSHFLKSLARIKPIELDL